MCEGTERVMRASTIELEARLHRSALVEPRQVTPWAEAPPARSPAGLALSPAVTGAVTSVTNCADSPDRDTLTCSYVPTLD
jgi:hypothetical protein